MKKPGAKSHRRERTDDRAVLLMQRAIGIVAKLEAGEPLATAERRWLANLLVQVLGDVDVRNNFFEAPAGAPRRASGRDTWLAVDYYARVAAGERGAGKAVAAAWNFRGPNASKQVAAIARRHRAAYAEVAHIAPAVLRRMIDAHVPKAKGTKTPGT